MLNLIENAVNHTPRGTTVRVITRAEGQDALVIVEDDGPGVPPELREKIFDRFVRAGGDVGKSTGLGLAIVRAVAQAHGGEVAPRGRRSGRALRRAPAARGRRPRAADRRARHAGCGRGQLLHAPRRAAAFARGIRLRPQRRA